MTFIACGAIKAHRHDVASLSRIIVEARVFGDYVYGVDKMIKRVSLVLNKLNAVAVVVFAGYIKHDSALFFELVEPPLHIVNRPNLNRGIRFSRLAEGKARLRCD